MLQTMVDSYYCLDRVVPERMCLVWRRSEVRNHKRRSRNTRLSSGTSANTSSSSRNVPGRMIRSNLFWYGNNLKMKLTYREKNLLDHLFGGLRSTLKEYPRRLQHARVRPRQQAQPPTSTQRAPRIFCLHPSLPPQDSCPSCSSLTFERLSSQSFLQDTSPPCSGLTFGQSTS